MKVEEIEGMTPDMIEALTQSLMVWAEQGYKAVIPMYHDVDGDEKPDYLGLDSFGKLEILSEGQVEAKDETVEGYEGPAWVRA